MNINELEERKNKVEKLIKAIENNETSMITKLEELKEMKTQKELMEFNVLQTVTNETIEETDSKGEIKLKAKFSNEDKRKAETKRILETNTVYNELIENIKDFERTIANDNIIIKIMNMKWKTEITFLNLEGIAR